MAFIDDHSLIRDWGDALYAQLLFWPFWVFLVSTLLAKETFVVPKCRRYYKITHSERLKVRKRRLRDALEDPVLVLLLEERLLRRGDINVDRIKMLEAMDQIREMANEDSTSEEGDGLGNGDATKGQEKLEAAEAIFMCTIALSILLFLSHNFVIHTTAWNYRNFRRSRIPTHHGQMSIYQSHQSSLGYYDWCGDWGTVLSEVLFCSIHLLHSFKLVRDATGRPKRTVTPQEDSEKAELVQPLLANANSN